MPEVILRVRKHEDRSLGAQFQKFRDSVEMLFLGFFPSVENIPIWVFRPEVVPKMTVYAHPKRWGCLSNFATSRDQILRSRGEKLSRSRLLMKGAGRLNSPIRREPRFLKS